MTTPTAGLRCALCNIALAVDAVRCSCGYEVTTGDVALAVRRLEVMQKVSRGEAAGGALGVMSALLMLTPVIATIPWSSAIAMMIWIGSAVVFAFGAPRLVRGSIRWSRARRQLGAAHAMKQLPPARVL